MREQPTKTRTGRKTRLLTIVIAAALLLAAAALIWSLTRREPSFSPPDFDPAVQSGVPTPEKRMGYGEVGVENGFSFSLASTMYQQEDGSLLIYLTNPENSGNNIQCEVVDETGRVLYRSGAIPPGAYVERLTPQEAFENETMSITIYVYAFAPDTWYSTGTISLINTLHPW